MGIDPTKVLIHARLPSDLFIRPNTTISAQEYFNLWYGIEKSVGGEKLPLILTNNLSLAHFDVPLFACICSPNLNIAVQRLSQYKPLVGPMALDINVNNSETQISISCYGHDQPLPKTVNLVELVFFTQLARLTTGQNIQPQSVELPQLLDDIQTYDKYFGCPLTQNHITRIKFSSEDAQRPFITSNALMWSFFEGDLKTRLFELDAQANTTQRLKSLLLEALPVGDYSSESMAKKLAMSKRTLQRKLAEENQNFNGILQKVREELAEHYLLESNISLSEISFLLGYTEPNSFFRAYNSWKGVSPGQYREQHKKQLT